MKLYFNQCYNGTSFDELFETSRQFIIKRVTYPEINCWLDSYYCLHSALATCPLRLPNGRSAPGSAGSLHLGLPCRFAWACRVASPGLAGSLHLGLRRRL